MNKNKKNSLGNDKNMLRKNNKCDTIHSEGCNNQSQKNKKGKCNMATLTANCDLAFIVDKEKTDEFLSVKPNKKIRSMQKIMAEQIWKNIIIESSDNINAKDK